MTQPDNPASIHFCRLRVARLAADGTTPAGSTNGYVADTLARLTRRTVNEGGDDVVVKNACGGLAFTYKSRDILKRYDLELAVLTPDPELHELLIGASLITTGGNTIGAISPQVGVLPTGAVSIEAWSRALLPNGHQDTTRPWFHWAFPWTEWSQGDKVLEEAPMAVVFNGQAFENPNWGNGPWNDWPGTALTRAAGWFRDTVIPDAAIGYVAVPTQV